MPTWHAWLNEDMEDGVSWTVTRALPVMRCHQTTGSPAPQHKADREVEIRAVPVVYGSTGLLHSVAHMPALLAYLLALDI